MQQGGIAILDFGSQVTELIARRVREAKVYCEILPHDVSMTILVSLAPRGIILSGGPSSVYERGAPRLPARDARKRAAVVEIEAHMSSQPPFFDPHAFGHGQTDANEPRPTIFDPQFACR